MRHDTFCTFFVPSLVNSAQISYRITVNEQDLICPRGYVDFISGIITIISHKTAGCT